MKTDKRIARLGVDGAKLTVEQELSIIYGEKNRIWPRSGNVVGISTRLKDPKIPDSVTKAANPKSLKATVTHLEMKRRPRTVTPSYVREP